MDDHNSSTPSYRGKQLIMDLLSKVANDTYDQVSEEEIADDELRDVVQLINDIHNQKRSLVSRYQDELSKSERRLREIVQSTPVGICITNQQGIFEFVNPTYCRLYGYSEDELLGNHFTMVVPPDDRPRLSHLHEEFMGQRWELRGEWTVVRKGGEPLNIIADAAYIIDIDGSPKKVTFVVDITDRKRAETRLEEMVHKLNREIEERKAISRVKEGVERIVRHDLKNPLNGILGAVQLLQMENLSENAKELLEVILESAEKLNKMLSSSFDFIRMENGTYQLHPESVDVAKVLSKVDGELYSLKSFRGVSTKYTVDGSTLAEASKNEKLSIAGEPIYLEDLFANLIRNAVEASEEGDVVRVLITTRDDSLRFDISNPAPVPSEIRGKFFDRYVTSGKKDGSGLGTYVAKLIARAHGGSIWFTSDEQEGTHVFVELPVGISVSGTV